VKVVFSGTYTIFQNYIQFPVSNVSGTQAEALDHGRKTATTMTMTYYCLCNSSSIVSAMIADQFWGKYRTLCVTCSIYLLGLIILVLSSTPISIERGIGFPGLICAMIFLDVAAGGFRTMVDPFIAEQYTRKTLTIKGLDMNGKKNIINL
jgi:POT family proton-dependent oligopeptide transporter